MTQAQGSTSRLLAGRYRLDSVLGRGGMGTVWRAEDEMLGRIVAVKELRLGGGVDEEEKRRLVTRTLREAKATARIRHAGAVTVFDVVEEDDRPWIVMELVESRSLSDVIKQDGPLTPERAAEIGLELLGVLRSAHGHGILHRDVKPSNVLIGDDGRVVLTDFGIASVEGDPSVTSTGMLVGAPSYISPERARGQKPGPPADLWSLGATLYAMVEGKPPYDRGSAISTLTAVMMDDLKEPRNAGPLRPVIEGLLRKDPKERLDEAATRSMLRRIVTEAARRAEATTRQAVATEATKVIPAVQAEARKHTGQDQSVEPPGTGAKDPGVGVGVGDTAAKVRETGTAAVQDAAVNSAPDAAEGADPGGSVAARRGSGVLGGLLGTVRVGSRTAPPADTGGEAAAAAAEQPVSPADQAAPPAGARGRDSGPARPKAPGSAVPRSRTAEPSSSAGSAVEGRPATAGAAREDAAAPATAILPAAAPAAAPAPGGSAPGGTVYGGGLAQRVRAWRSQPAAERRPTSRTLLVAAIAVALVVVAAVLGVRAASDTSSPADRGSAGHAGGGKGSPSPRHAPAGSSKSPDAPTTVVAAPPAAPESPATTPPPASAPPGSGGDDHGGGDGKGGVPAGFTTYTDKSEGFSILVPKGMKYAREAKDGGSELHYKKWVLIVHRRPDATADALADWRARESQSHTGWPYYHQIGAVHAVSYRGWNAAEWEWTYNKPSDLKHTVSRAFVVGKDKDRAYLIQWITPEDQWDKAETKRARDISYSSFKPLH